MTMAPSAAETTTVQHRPAARRRVWRRTRSVLESGLKAVGLDAAARTMLRRVEGGRRSRMRFPPYAADIQQLVATSADPVRYALVAMAVESVLREDIDGDIAEVGVYRGELSRLIHRMAPDRTLFLFDTFAGFPEADLDRAGDRRFRDTSVETVSRRIGDLTNVELRVGYFPDTAAGLEPRTFSLVVLDLDLYKPTVAGLEFFYPRMAPGGYVILDDYNNSESGWAVSRAVMEFMVDKPERPIQIPDAWGTLVLRKL